MEKGGWRGPRDSVGEKLGSNLGLGTLLSANLEILTAVTCMAKQIVVECNEDGNRHLLKIGNASQDTGAEVVCADVIANSCHLQTRLVPSCHVVTRQLISYAAASGSQASACMFRVMHLLLTILQILD